MEFSQYDMIGGCGEAIVAAEFLKRGVPVYRPVVDVGADLIVDIGGRLQRVQVKSSGTEGRSVHFHLGRRNRKRGKGSSWKPYGEKVDWFALCCLVQNYIALISPGRGTTRLTFSPRAMNGRLKKIEIGAVIDRLLEGEHD